MSARARKQAEAEADALPAYEEVDSASGAGSSRAAPPSPLQLREKDAHISRGPPSAGPTIASPFDFPSEDTLAPLPPAYPVPSPLASHPVVGTALPPEAAETAAAAAIPTRRPIAIPQTHISNAAPFVDAYPSTLLNYGITRETWHSFLSTMSAFLAAKVSDQALRHAVDIGRTLAENPKRFGKGTLQHAKSIGHGIRSNARERNFVGAALGVVGGAVLLPVGTALRAAGAVASLPGSAVRAVTQKPQTPKERAAAYAAAANKKWLQRRGLTARLLDSRELSDMMQEPAEKVYRAARANADKAAVVSMGEDDLLSPWEVSTDTRLDLGDQTLWLVVIQYLADSEERESIGSRGSKDSRGSSRTTTTTTSKGKGSPFG